MMDHFTKDKAGFDLTDFGSARLFEEFCEEFGVSTNGEQREDDLGITAWYWDGEKLSVRTKNNPISGEYADAEMRTSEQGYASYIQLTGDSEVVEAAYNWILDNAERVKNHVYGQHW